MSLAGNERLKLTASDLNTGAGACFAAGVVAPLAAVTFGYAGATMPVSPLTFIFGVTTFFLASLSLHVATRPAERTAVLSQKIVAFVVTPLMAAAFGWGAAIWARSVAK